MATVIINMGSNRGDRRLYLSRGVAAIASEFGGFEASHAVESAAWGYESANPYLNICLMFASDLEPEQILDKLQAIERRICPEPHRGPDGSYRDRKLDIDIVAIDDRVIRTDRLVLPHPHLAERRFFLEPLAEIAPGWRHPLSGQTASEMLSALNKTAPSSQD